MKTQEVQFGGNNYPCRVVESNEGEEPAPRGLPDTLCRWLSR